MGAQRGMRQADLRCCVTDGDGWYVAARANCRQNAESAC
jgi:hypothetical protein